MDESSGELKRYFNEQSKYWDWPYDEWHEVVYLGAKIDNWKNVAETVLYTFEFKDGKVKQKHVRALDFAKKMEIYDEGSHLEMRRWKEGKNTKYDVKLID